VVNKRFLILIILMPAAAFHLTYFFRPTFMWFLYFLCCSFFYFLGERERNFHGIFLTLNIFNWLTLSSYYVVVIAAAVVVVVLECVCL